MGVDERETVVCWEKMLNRWIDSWLIISQAMPAATEHTNLRQSDRRQMSRLSYWTSAVLWRQPAALLVPAPGLGPQPMAPALGCDMVGAGIRL